MEIQDEKLDIENEKEPDVNKKKQKCLLLCCLITLFSYIFPQGDQQANKYFNLSWLRVGISYHIFDNLAELLNRDLATKIGQGILSKYLIYRKCNCSLPFKFNEKCVYEDKCQSKWLIYEVKWSMCDTIYIGNTQQKQK